MSFADLSTRAQVARLRVTALEALRSYPINVASLKLLNHGFNTTFRVDTTDGRKFALRLNVNSRRSPEQIRAEMAWLDALSRDTDLHLPTPQKTTNDGLMLEVYSPDLERNLFAALFSWLPGKNLGDDATPAQMREVGRAAAILHRHALHWRLPKGTSLASHERLLIDTPNNFDADVPHLNHEARVVVSTVFDKTSHVLRDLFARDTPRVLHADLHNWNLKWARGKLYVFDFDDSCIGVPLLDLAIAAYYQRPDDSLETAMLEGYQSVASLPEFSSAEYEAVVAGRNLLLLNDLVTNTNAKLRALLPQYAANSIKKLRAYLETGVFRHDVPGVISLPTS
jgi:Ser/Thr protein kinase RdoA (MazF antagonist)